MLISPSFLVNILYYTCQDHTATSRGICWRGYYTGERHTGVILNFNEERTDKGIILVYSYVILIDNTSFDIMKYINNDHYDE